MVAQWDTVTLRGHTCVVVSDPQLDPEHVFLAVFSTFEPYKDDACLLNSGDHPSITHLTCVCYDFFDGLFSASYLDSLPRRDPVPHLSARILSGARETKRIANEAWCLLDRQHQF